MLENAIRKLLRKPPLTEHEIAARHIHHLDNANLKLFWAHFTLMSVVDADRRSKGISIREMLDMIEQECEQRHG